MSDDIKLPELPEPETLFLGTPGFGSIFKRHTDEAMRAYARAAVELNRAWQPIETAPYDVELLLLNETINDMFFGHVPEDIEVHGQCVSMGTASWADYWMHKPATAPPKHGEV